MSLKAQLTDAMKQAMRSGDKNRLGIVRMALAAVKRHEVDNRIEADDAIVLVALEKMVKQGRESERQFRDAGRLDLADKEAAEILVLQEYLPKQLGEAELAALIDEIVTATGAESVRDMGKVMGQLKSRAQGSVDMGVASAMVKARLQS